VPTAWVASLIVCSALTTSPEMPFRALISPASLSVACLARFLTLGCDNGKAPACFAGAGGFDGGIEREQIDLAGDVPDQLYDPLHGLRRRAQALGLVIDRVDLADRIVRDLL
jgi:hypothetical protein